MKNNNIKTKKKKNLSDKEIILKSFKKNKRKIFFYTFFALLSTLVSIGITGLQFFYPYHFAIGLSVFIFSFMLFVRNIYLSRKSIKKFKSYSFASKFIKFQKRKIIVIILIIILAATFFYVRPMNDNPFKDLSPAEIKNIVNDNLYQAVTAMDYLESTGNTLLQSLDTDIQNTNSAKSIKKDFDKFLDAVVYSEYLTEKHRYFDKISKSQKDIRMKSFLISYSLYIKKYEIIHRIKGKVHNNEYKKKILNQYVEIYENNGIYSKMVNRFYYPKTRLRITSGRLYMKKISSKNLGEIYKVLSSKSKESYRYLFFYFDETVGYSVFVFFDEVKRKMFNMWFPIQKSVANAMGHTILSTRGKEGIIQVSEIQKMRKKMQPGDIMLQRRNWHLSNLGIPGFWTHSALYTGEFEEMEKYFITEFPYKGYNTFSEFIKEKYPKVYKEYQENININNKHAVIEAIEPGVILQSLNKSANADFIVTLRPNLSKKEKLEAILTAFSNFGKPYDYNFDFDTRDALVCSELIYDAYYPKSDSGGLNFSTTIINGRKIVSPLDMAHKFRNEKDKKNKELFFVYFIRSNEKMETSWSGTKEEFLESIDWSKFSFLQ